MSGEEPVEYAGGIKTQSALAVCLLKGAQVAADRGGVRLGIQEAGDRRQGKGGRRQGKGGR